jgi:hypothetical protein
MQDAQGDAHGRSNTDGGGAADFHVANRAGHLAVIGVRVPNFLRGKAALVENHDAAVGPFDGLGYVHADFS